MTQLAWPLQRNMIRRQIPNNAFGKVRNNNTKDHQGWDLYAVPMTPCYAVADGRVWDIQRGGDYGTTMILSFEYGERTLYAAYCHLSVCIVAKGDEVVQSQEIAMTGTSGNASNMSGADWHLHFEIRTAGRPGAGMAGRLDPAQFYGRAPISTPIIQGHGAKPLTAGIQGIKVPGFNVLP